MSSSYQKSAILLLPQTCNKKTKPVHKSISTKVANQFWISVKTFFAQYFITFIDLSSYLAIDNIPKYQNIRECKIKLGLTLYLIVIRSKWQSIGWGHDSCIFAEYLLLEMHVPALSKGPRDQIFKPPPPMFQRQAPSRPGWLEVG